jgi:hypothetical protein
VLAFLTTGFSAVTLTYLTPSLFQSFRSVPSQKQVEASRTSLLLTNEETFRPRPNRPVYPYSVVPGGIEDASDLKYAAEHDPVVAAHYAGFDYDHARVVRLVLARSVYVSYRIGNKVYWTHRRVTLKKGEKIITDGKMIARSRCANRVEELPQQATSSYEPPAAKFDEPMPPLDGIALQNPPLPFQSALMSRPGAPGAEPGPTSSLYSPFNGGFWIPTLPPPLPSGLCEPTKKKGSGGGGKKKPVPCGSGGGSESVPEPGTWLLMGAGMAAIYWQVRRKAAGA